MTAFFVWKAFFYAGFFLASIGVFGIFEMITHKVRGRQKSERAVVCICVFLIVLLIGGMLTLDFFLIEKSFIESGGTQQ
jgi:hypothetical protein